MNELERLHNGLGNSNMLLLKNKMNGLECIFIKEGLEVDHFLINNNILADALAKASVNGIVEGSDFSQLKNNYDWFSLRVRSKALFLQLQEIHA